MAKKQLSIAGTEAPSIKELDDAGEAYLVERNKRMKMTVKEKDAKTALIAVMKKHNLEVYTFEDDDGEHVITLSEKSNVKVSDVEDLGDEAGEEVAS
jgi:hypothetical protein